MALAVLAGIIGLDISHIGFFADDFHFLDVARRIPLLRALDGHAGVYPWYRPLSRELYFATVVAAGRWGLWLARCLSLVCVFASAWQIRALGLRLLAPRAAAIAPVLFLVYATTRFLTGWASGFQDLLALLLALLAVRAQLRGRFGRAIAWAFLGLFAKESAALVFPILAMQMLWHPARREAHRWWLRQAGALVAGVAIHAAVRTTWNGLGVAPEVQPSVPALGGALWRVVGGFVSGAPGYEPAALASALLALAATLALLEWMPAAARSAPRDGRDAMGESTSHGTMPLLWVAAALGFLPLILGHLMGRATASEYYAFSAAPWISLLLASALARMPRAMGTLLLLAVVAWDTLALHFRAVDPMSPDAWRSEGWSWHEAARLSAVSNRLQEDIRLNLGVRPESLVVLLSGMENHCYFQTEDGPATRETLLDPTVRAYWLSSPPYGLLPGRFEILVFNQESRHLERHRLPLGVRSELAATAVAAGNAPKAWALASYGDSAENARFQFRYFRAAAALISEGISGYTRELALLNLGDSTGDATPERIAEHVVGRASGAYEPLLRVLRHPLDVGGHVLLADSLHSVGSLLTEAVELRIAVSLDPARSAERLRLGNVLLLLGQSDAARQDR